MSIENLIAATEAMNALTARMTDFMDGVDDDLAAHQAAYAALSANLKGVVNGQMYFSGTVDPDEAAPTNVGGGTFNSLMTMINAAPNGALVMIYLPADKTVPLDAVISVQSKTLFIKKTGAGANPIIDVQAYNSNGYNRLYGFSPLGASAIILDNIDVNLLAADPVPGDAWAGGYKQMVHYITAGHTVVGVRYGTVTGTDGRAIMSAKGGGAAHMGLFNVTIDGAVYAVNDADMGSIMISQSGVTLQNGAALTDGGTIGTNITQN